jgi:outer membrane protein assembly complex protein YaeT
MPATSGRVLRLAVLLAAVALAACTQGGPSTGPYPRFAEFAGREVQSVEFVGEVVVPKDSLRSILATRPTTCRLGFLPICPFGFGRQRHVLDLEELARDVTRIQLFHRDHGYYGTRVSPAVDPEGEEAVSVRFAIVPGERVTTRSVEVEGTEGIIPRDEVEKRLPLEEGEPFGRSAFLASADSVRGVLLRRGHAYAQVLRNYTLDTIADVADARFGAIPGPLVRVDTVVVLGTDRLERRTVLKQLAFREGEVLDLAKLNQSQRNLYDLGLVSFASVQLAPDSLQVDPDSARATVVVRIVEAPRYLAEASAGYGTLDCLRTQGRLVDRNFLGGSRRLELNGSLSKIGTGSPLSLGLENNLCRELQRDTLFSDTLNYRVAATFVQPRLFGTQTSTTLNLHAEKLSEFRTYLRVSRGAQVAVQREIARQTLVTTTVNVERGRTNAREVFFCVTLLVCEPERIDTLRASRWSNSVGATLAHDRTRYRVYPVGGYQLRATTDWASAYLGSDDRYLRLLADGSTYREIRRGWVLAGRLMGGAFVERFFGEEGFIPPERRFYAGGPNTVRGVERNALGPTVYVTEQELVPTDSLFEKDEVDIAATGGTRLVVGSVELRMPSPVLSSNLRLAAFVDAGTVWTGDRLTAGGDTFTFKPRVVVTPGVGARYLSPVGPIRVDLGLKTQRPGEGPLFGIGEDSGELIFLGRFERPPLEIKKPWDVLDLFQLYIAVGQPF